VDVDAGERVGNLGDDPRGGVAGERGVDVAVEAAADRRQRRTHETQVGLSMVWSGGPGQCYAGSKTVNNHGFRHISRSRILQI